MTALSRTFRALLIVASAALTACDKPAVQTSSEPVAFAPGILLVGTISEPAIKESSGVASSQRYPGVLWTHNDGGGPKKQFLYAITRQGATVAIFPVTGANFSDWEDIAADNSGHLYLGDIGNNDAKRDRLRVYQIDEPNPADAPTAISIKRIWTLLFPERPFDCESLFIWGDFGYVVSKVFNDEPAQIYRFPLASPDRELTLETVATTSIRSPVTGGAISSDGKLLGLVAKDGAYVYQTDGDVARVSSTKPYYTPLNGQHIEGCCFEPDGLLATSENRKIFLFKDKEFRP